MVGLSQRLADAEILKKQEYFGKFGRIHKVVVNQSTSYVGSQVSFQIIFLSVKFIYFYYLVSYTLFQRNESLSIQIVTTNTSQPHDQQGPSASAYVTYTRPEDAYHAILAVNNLHIDHRNLKASLGTTKYCSQFLKGAICSKAVCTIFYIFVFFKRFYKFCDKIMKLSTNANIILSF